MPGLGRHSCPNKWINGGVRDPRRATRGMGSTVWVIVWAFTATRAQS